MVVQVREKEYKYLRNLFSTDVSDKIPEMKAVEENLNFGRGRFEIKEDLGWVHYLLMFINDEVKKRNAST